MKILKKKKKAMFSEKVILTGIRPTGEIHLGHYFGFIKTLLEFQNNKDNKIFLMIADFHAQATPFLPNKLREDTIATVKGLLALGVDPNRVVIFKQSDIPAHLVLFWILSTLAPLGDLTRLHQFKEFSKRYKKEGITSSILMYPVLQAADILLYQPDLVPVGKDQLQHLELARELARRFNKRFGKIFKLPKAFLKPEGEKIMSLDDPLKKMSKSLPEGALFIFESISKIKEKIKKAVTDSGKDIKYDPENKPGISNLLIIYKGLTQERSLSELEKKLSGLSYSTFKEKIFEAFVNYFQKAREVYSKFTYQEISTILEKGKKIANERSQEVLEKVLNLTGLR